MTMRALFQKVAAAIDLRDLLAFGGLGLVAYGLLAVYAPAAPIVVGAVLFWMGVR